jgi:3-hydroxybutyryl-CoA dehydratase
MSELSIGQSVEHARRIDAADFVRFASLSGDLNPIHQDPEFAATTRFGKVIAPGLLVASYFSAEIANTMPGPGSIYMSQTLTFLRPVFHDDEVVIRLTVLEFPKAGMCRLSTECLRDGVPVLTGEALVKLP